MALTCKAHRARSYTTTITSSPTTARAPDA